jgi:hypothetical protein
MFPAPFTPDVIAVPPKLRNPVPSAVPHIQGQFSDAESIGVALEEGEHDHFLRSHSLVIGVNGRSLFAISAALVQEHNCGVLHLNDVSRSWESG